MDIPANPEVLTAEWLTTALRSSDTIHNARVTSFDISRVQDEHGRNKGILGVSCFLTLQYDINEGNAPESLYIKFSSPIETVERALIYQNEVRFYQDLAHRSGIRTPQCYYSDINVETGEHILLLEHIASARSSTYITGYSLEEAQRSIRSIAKFHATWWESPELETFDWLTENDLDTSENDFQDVWDNFVTNFERPIPEVMQKIGAKYGKILVKANSLHKISPRTLIHGDYFIENLLLPENEDSVVVIDWQILMRGRGAWDVAYNLCLGLSTELRQMHENSLLQLYHKTLLENGVVGYSYDDFYTNYRLSLLRPLHIFVVLVGFRLFEGEHHTRMIDVGLPRLTSILTDHKVAELY